jgi:hypothetical protein
VERCHDVIFHETDFPGVSAFAPTDPSHQYDPLSPINFDETDETATSNDTTPPTPSQALQDVLDWRSAEDELDLDAPLMDVNPFFPHSEDNEEVAQLLAGPSLTSVTAPKPGFDYILTSNKAPKDISSTVNESNILHTKRRANLALALTASEIPRTYREAMLSSEASSWERAVDAKLEAMKDLKVWTVELTPGNESLLGTVWVFRKKKDSEGIIVKFKARLCAQGSQQHDG